MKKDIRVGDTVKIISAEDCIADTVGLIGTVTEYTPDNKNYDYQVSLPEYYQFVADWGYKENELELVEVEKNERNHQSSRSLQRQPIRSYRHH